MPQNRWKSKVLWGSIAAQVVAFLQLTGFWAQVGLEVGYVGNIVSAILMLLATIGIINDPTDSERL